MFGADAEARLSQRSLPDGEEALSFAAELQSAGSIVACGNINLKINRGEFFVLMGLSGSGKSTLMRCMSRLTEPSAGELLLEGENFLKASAKELMAIRRQKMGIVFQHFGLFPHMTVLGNVTFPLRVYWATDFGRLKNGKYIVESGRLAIEIEGESRDAQWRT